MKNTTINTSVQAGKRGGSYSKNIKKMAHVERGEKKQEGREGRKGEEPPSLENLSGDPKTAGV